ncbi:MAG TPA: adenine phosphoribosyltransferase [Dehalococcoidia bacterium]|nr:adenine phosphoribosyltransferase [Dehalococcoidia bacterium]
MDLKAYIRDVPDFPEPGVLFRDATPLLHDPTAFRAALDGLTDYASSRSPNAIVGIESRGFLFGAPVAAHLGLPFVPIRKPGKLPAARMSVEYSLEYGAGQLDIHADALRPGDSAVIIDDLIATGGTAAGAARLVESLGARVAGLAFLIELTSLGGRAQLAGYDVFALIAFD